MLLQPQPASSEAYELLHKGSIALARVEHAGIRIDVEYLEAAQKAITKKIATLENELRSDTDVYPVWKKRYGEQTNLGSKQQLSSILFGKLGYQSVGETASGQFKSDESAFSNIDLPFVRKYFECEKLKKAKGTYLDGIARELVDGFLHPSFDLNTAKTYRSGSSNPNFQNMPIRNKEIGQLVRKCFIARHKHRLVEVDYSGIEVRIAACYHKDPVMMEYIRDPSKDMHRDMAAQCYLLPVKHVSKDARYAAKNMFVFPQFYGDYYIHCAQNLWEAIDKLKLSLPDGTPLKQHLKANGIRKLGELNPKEDPKKGTFELHLKEVEYDFWNNRFSVYGQWKKDWWEQYQSCGSFSTLTGFRFDGVFGRNEVINYPVQGSAFHCLLWTLIQMVDWLSQKDMQSVIVGQIHDSILADVHEDELQTYLHKIAHVSTTKLRKHWPWIITPLDIEIEVTPVGGSWYEKEKWVLHDNGMWGPEKKG